LIVAFFFFSSRRRHTRSLRDWSSDVCSSDLLARPRGHSYCRSERAMIVDYALPRRRHSRRSLLALSGSMNDRAGVQVTTPAPREIGRASCREGVWVRVGGG